MIPLIWLLLGWLVLMAIFAIATLLTVSVYVRYGVAYASTYLASAAFLGVIALVLIVTGLKLLMVDWSSSLNLYSGFNPSLY